MPAKRTKAGGKTSRRDGRAASATRAAASVKASKRPPTKTATKTAKKTTARASSARDPVARLRAICLALPGAHEVHAWGEPTFRVNNKIFAMHASANTHHGAGREAVWILSVNIEQDLVLRARPDRYFKPPYVGPSGWIGAWLDRSPPWSELEELLRDAYRRRAPKKLAGRLGD
jgi:hypothetical protein